MTFPRFGPFFCADFTARVKPPSKRSLVKPSLQKFPEKLLEWLKLPAQILNAAVALDKIWHWVVHLAREWQ